MMGSTTLVFLIAIVSVRQVSSQFGLFSQGRGGGFGGQGFSNYGSSSSYSGQAKSTRCCDYKCKSNGGCEVSWNRGSCGFNSKLSGSCFSQTFGGGCIGIPDGCDNCHTVVNCNGGGIQQVIPQVIPPNHNHKGRG